MPETKKFLKKIRRSYQKDTRVSMKGPSLLNSGAVMDYNLWNKTEIHVFLPILNRSTNLKGMNQGDNEIGMQECSGQWAPDW